MNTKQSIFIMLAMSLIVLLSSVRFVLADTAQSEVNKGLGTVKPLEFTNGPVPVYEVEGDIYYSDVYDRYVEWNVIDKSTLDKELERLRKGK